MACVFLLYRRPIVWRCEIIKNYKVKICIICGKEFIPTGNYQKYCKECKGFADKERDDQYSKKYNQEHFEYIKQYLHQYYKIHSEHIQQNNKKWIVTHSERYKELERKHTDKRQRNLGYIPLNEWQEGYEFHHINQNYGVYMPKILHKSIYHNLMRGINMHIINALAMDYIR